MYSFPGRGTRKLPEKIPRSVEVIDTWEMTVTDLGVFSASFRVPLPGKKYMAIRLRKV